jgi:hypothetical protein
MNSFSAIWTAFFTAFTTFAATSRRMFKKIIDLLVKFKKTLSDVEGDVTTIKGDVTTLKDDVAKLSQVKGNYEALPYNYGKDASTGKPASGVTAADLFDYVTNLLGITPAHGKTYQIQFSGAESIPVNVNGDVESGNPSETLMVVINDFGVRSYVYQSNLQDEYFKVITDGASTTKTAIDAEQTELNTLESLLDAMAA